MHDIVTMVVDKAPTKWWPLAKARLRDRLHVDRQGAKNMDSAKKFDDWALTSPAQKLGAEAKSYPGAVEQDTPVPPEASNSKRSS